MTTIIIVNEWLMQEISVHSTAGASRIYFPVVHQVDHITLTFSPREANLKKIEKGRGAQGRGEKLFQT